MPVERLFDAFLNDFDTLARAYEGYIFDLDGTLADSMPVHFYAWRQALADNGARFQFTGELFYSRAGMGTFDTVGELSRAYQQELPAQAIIRDYHAILERTFTTVDPIEPVAQLARSLKAAGAKIAVASGGNRETVEKTLAMIGMEGFFPVVVTKDDVTHSKPHPETFLVAAEQLGAEPSRCIVFEDSMLGVRAAQSAGMDWVYLKPDVTRFA